MGEQPYLAYFPKPSPYPNQVEAMEKIFSALKDRKRILFEGACGTGKTLSAIAPALTLADERKLKVVIATPVHQQMAQFIEEAREIHKKSGIKAIAFIGKEKMCPLGKTAAQCEVMALATQALKSVEHELAGLKHGQTDRDFSHDAPMVDQRDIASQRLAKEKNLARLKGLSCPFLYNTRKADVIGFRKWLFDDVRSPEEISQASREIKKCGYELSKKNLADADLIICNYHHLLAEEYRERFLGIIGCRISDLIIVMDEAHNLEAAARSSAIAPIDEHMIAAALRDVANIRPEDNEDGDTLKKQKDYVKAFLDCLMQTIRSTWEGSVKFGQLERQIAKAVDIRIRDPEGSHDRFIKKFQEKLSEQGIDSNKALKSAQKLGERVDSRLMQDLMEGRREVFELSQLTGIARFMLQYMALSENELYYPVLSIHRGVDGIAFGRLELCNCTPITVTRELLAGPYAVVLMSATLQPFNKVIEILGISGTVESIAFSTPYPAERRKTFVIDEGPLFFSNRDDPDIEKRLAKLFQDIIDASPGNVLFFFQTHKEAQRYSGLIRTDIPVLVPKVGESPEAIKQKFFQIGRDGQKSVLMAYLWGSLTEGVDYKDDRCRTVVIVGVGLQNYREDRMKAVINAYDHLYNGNGMEYAISEAAVKKIRQACGRVIRSPTDYGITILVDRRFTRAYSQKNPTIGLFFKFPESERNEFIRASQNEIKGMMESFFTGIS
jgi:DNA excision repair protein ERCC-2